MPSDHGSTCAVRFAFALSAAASAVSVVVAETFETAMIFCEALMTTESVPDPDARMIRQSFPAAPCIAVYDVAGWTSIPLCVEFDESIELITAWQYLVCDVFA